MLIEESSIPQSSYQEDSDPPSYTVVESFPEGYE